MIYGELFFVQSQIWLKEYLDFLCSVRDTPASKSGKELYWTKCQKDVGMVGLDQCAVKVYYILLNHGNIELSWQQSGS